VYTGRSETIGLHKGMVGGQCSISLGLADTFLLSNLQPTTGFRYRSLQVETMIFTV
jgi:hypothetical protein